MNTYASTTLAGFGGRMIQARETVKGEDRSTKRGMTVRGNADVTPVGSGEAAGFFRRGKERTWTWIHDHE